MSEMSCGPRRPAENRPIHQGRAADAGAQSQQNRITFSAGGSPEHFRNQRRASVVIGIERQALGGDYIRQKVPFEEVQVSGKAVYPGSRSVDNAFASNADAAHRRLGLLQDEVYKIAQVCRSARRRLVKTLDQISVQINERAFDGSAADVNANGDGLIRRSVCPVLSGSQSLCIIRTLCHPSGPSLRHAFRTHLPVSCGQLKGPSWITGRPATIRTARA